MSRLIKYSFVRLLFTLFAAIVVSSCSSDEPKEGEWDLDKLPGYFPPFGNILPAACDGGVGSCKAYGLVGEDGIAISCISTKEIGEFDNIYDYVNADDALDVKAYCEELGYKSYPNTSDFYVSFKWIEINSFKDKNQRDGVISVRLQHNPYNQPRILWVRLQNMKTSVLRIIQEGNPDGIDPPEESTPD